MEENGMKVSVARRLGVALLYLAVHLGIGGCSSSEEEAGDLEATNEEQAANVEEDASQEASEEGNGGEELAQEAGNEAAPEEEVTNVPDQGVAEGEQVAEAPVEGQANSTEGDLQQIISEMNSGGNTAAAEAAPANAAPAPEAVPAPVAPVASASPALPEMGSKMPYIVQHGDTLAKIAQKVYGDTAMWQEIASFSGINNPKKIFPGDVVYYQLNDKTQAFAMAYDSAPRAEVVVQKGDTLASIAKRVLGASSEWKHLWRMNDGIDNPDRIESGMSLVYMTHSAQAQVVEKAKVITAQLKTKSIKVAKNTFVTVLNTVPAV